MEIVSADRPTRVERLTSRLANVEQSLREARAPDVTAFLQELREEILAELAVQRTATVTSARRSADVIQLFPDNDGPARCA